MVIELDNIEKEIDSKSPLKRINHDSEQWYIPHLQRPSLHFTEMNPRKPNQKGNSDLLSCY